MSSKLSVPLKLICESMTSQFITSTLTMEIYLVLSAMYKYTIKSNILPFVVLGAIVKSKAEHFIRIIFNPSLSVFFRTTRRVLDAITPILYLFSIPLTVYVKRKFKPDKNGSLPIRKITGISHPINAKETTILMTSLPASKIDALFYAGTSECEQKPYFDTLSNVFQFCLS